MSIEFPLEPARKLPKDLVRRIVAAAIREYANDRDRAQMAEAALAHVRKDWIWMPYQKRKAQTFAEAYLEHLAERMGIPSRPAEGPAPAPEAPMPMPMPEAPMPMPEAPAPPPALESPAPEAPPAPAPELPAEARDVAEYVLDELRSDPEREGWNYLTDPTKHRMYVLTRGSKRMAQYHPDVYGGGVEGARAGLDRDLTPERLAAIWQTLITPFPARATPVPQPAPEPETPAFKPMPKPKPAKGDRTPRKSEPRGDATPPEVAERLARFLEFVSIDAPEPVQMVGHTDPFDEKAFARWAGRHFSPGDLLPVGRALYVRRGKRNMVAVSDRHRLHAIVWTGREPLNPDRPEHECTFVGVEKGDEERSYPSRDEINARTAYLMFSAVIRSALTDPRTGRVSFSSDAANSALKNAGMLAKKYLSRRQVLLAADAPKFFNYTSETQEIEIPTENFYGKPTSLSAGADPHAFAAGYFAQAAEFVSTFKARYGEPRLMRGRDRTYNDRVLALFDEQNPLTPGVFLSAEKEGIIKADADHLAVVMPIRH